MLYATTMNKDNEVQQHHWYVGQFFAASAYHVIEIQADCDELSHILAHVKGLKHSDQPVQRWYGDDAKFIAGYLLMYGCK